MVTVRTTVDSSAVYAMVRTFEQGLYNAESFAARRIESKIRGDVFYNVVHLLGARAGEGFPEVYRDHLANFMKKTIQIDVIAEGDGFMSVTYDLDGLGGYKELELGAHHQALIAIPPGAYGSNRKGKYKYNIHPPRVTLPYLQQPLHNESDTRTEFWEQVIIGRDFDYTMGLMRGMREWTIGELLDNDIPTFEEVAAARVIEAWGPSLTAPEWLLLENGFSYSEPKVPPMDFSRTLKNVSNCVAEKIYTGALQGLVHAAERAGGQLAVGSTGIPYYRPTGRFAEFKEDVEQSTADTSECFGRL